MQISPILYAVGVVPARCLLHSPYRQQRASAPTSWIKLGPIGFEPAEFAKIAYILGHGVVSARAREQDPELLHRADGRARSRPFRFVLVLKQPALGYRLGFLSGLLRHAFCRGRAAALYRAAAGARGACVTVMAYYWIHVWDKPVPFLKPSRSTASRFSSIPASTPRASGWQVDQSMIAIGSGGMDGKGWRQGTETVLGYLPKNTSYNDLIFPVVGEDFGFRGGAALIICEGTVLLWCLWVAARARDKIGALVAVGVMTMLFTHIFVNIGMTIQLVPITGIPLPFISYGGTFLVACLAAMGLVQSVWVHRKNFERI